MININFDRIYLLLIAVPLLLALIIPYAIAIRKSNRSKSVVISLVIHIVIAVALALAAAGAQVTAIITETEVYVVADVSYSANKNLDLVDEHIRSVEKALPENSKMGVIAFGDDYELLTPLGGSIKSVKDADVDDSATDIQSALQYAGSLFGKDVVKRIVLITDGKQTDVDDAGGLVNVIEQLYENDVYIDAIYLDDNLTDDAKEVQVTSVEFNKSTYIDHASTARALLQSSSDNANVTVTLTCNGETVKNAYPTLSRGYNIVEFTLPTSETGDFHYTISVRAEGGTEEEPTDGNLTNNEFSFTQTVSDELEILLITTKQSDVERAESLYGDKANITSYVNNPNVPFDVEDLVVYDEILLSEVDVRDLNNYTAFMAALDTVVSNYGKSLITMGDTNIQNQPDDVLKNLEDMLPVKFGNQDQESKSVTLVIDVSRSMEFNYKLKYAKQAALQVLELLNDQDTLHIVAFAESVEAWSYFQVGGYRNQIIDRINNKLELIQGTMLTKGLQRAISLVEADAHQNKQILLISDGYSYVYGGEDPAVDAKTLYETHGAPISVINTCTMENGTAEARDAIALLQNIAQAGGGSYYYVANEGDVTRLILEEVAEDMTESVVEGTNPVLVHLKSDDSLNGIETLPSVNGFIYAKEKRSATVVLKTEFESASGKIMSSPIYAYWDYGNGRVSTFTSTLSGAWTNAWADGTGKTFMQNLLKTNLPEEKQDYPFETEFERKGETVRLNLTPATLHYDTVAKVEITTPSGETTTETFYFNGSKYYYSFEAEELGAYTFKIIYKHPYRDEVQTTLYYDVSYGSEYDSFTTFNVADLHKAIRARGNVYTDGKNIRLVNDKDDVATYTYHLTMPLMIAVVALFVVDVCIRKLRWADIKNLFGLREKKKAGKKGDKI